MNLYLVVVAELDSHVAIVLVLVALNQVQHLCPVTPGDKGSRRSATMASILADSAVPQNGDEAVTPATVDGGRRITCEKEGSRFRLPAHGVRRHRKKGGSNTGSEK